MIENIIAYFTIKLGCICASIQKFSYLLITIRKNAKNKKIMLLWKRNYKLKNEDDFLTKDDNNAGQFGQNVHFICDIIRQIKDWFFFTRK